MTGPVVLESFAGHSPAQKVCQPLACCRDRQACAQAASCVAMIATQHFYMMLLLLASDRHLCRVLIVLRCSRRSGLGGVCGFATNDLGNQE